MNRSADLQQLHDATLQPPGAAQPLTVRSSSVAETRWLGALLGGLLHAGDIVLLHGGLGAGKTALTQGIARGLDVSATVNSPTFTLLKEYAGRLPLYHFDLYRIDDPAEVHALGFDDYFVGDGVCIIEWAEQGQPANASAPWPDIWLRCTLHRIAPDARVLLFDAAGARGAALLAAFASAIADAQPYVAAGDEQDTPQGTPDGVA